MKRPVRVIRRQEIYRGRIIRLIQEELSCRGRRIIRETIEHPGAVVVLPVLPDGRLVLVRQYRRAVDRWLLELPAGTRDRRESETACARRELEEEAGWRAGQLRLLSRFYAAPGCLSERMTLFLATGLRRTTPHPEPDESLRPATLTLQAAVRKIRTGAICDAKTIIGILWLSQNAQKDHREHRMSSDAL